MTSLQIIFVSKQVTCPAKVKFDLTGSQSGRIKHVFANWYCGPVVKLKHSIFAHKLHNIYIKFSHCITNALSQCLTRLRFSPVKTWPQ